MSQSRQALLSAWAYHRLRLYARLNDIQIRWRQLANQYTNLPLGFRRDMSLGLHNERFSCAALLEHVAAFPQILSDTDFFTRAGITQAHDMMLSEYERCPVSFGWYAMLHRAAGWMRRWETVSDDDVNPQLIIEILDKAEEALQTATAMVQRLASSLPEYPQARPNQAMTKAWNTMCDTVKGGASIETAGEAMKASAPYVDGPGIYPHRNGAPRVWVQCEIALPEQSGSNSASSEEDAAVSDTIGRHDSVQPATSEQHRQPSAVFVPRPNAPSFTPGKERKQ